MDSILDSLSCWDHNGEMKEKGNWYLFFQIATTSQPDLMVEPMLVIQLLEMELNMLFILFLQQLFLQILLTYLEMELL